MGSDEGEVESGGQGACDAVKRGDSHWKKEIIVLLDPSPPATVSACYSLVAGEERGCVGPAER